MLVWQSTLQVLKIYMQNIGSPVAFELILKKHWIKFEYRMEVIPKIPPTEYF